MEIIIIFLSIIIIILAVFSAIVSFNSFKIKKMVDELLEKGNIKDFKDIFLSQKDKNDRLEKDLQEAFLRIKELEDIAKITIQKTAVVRFNPFNELGGNQSFVIALLDAKNNGFVISSLFVKEGNRVYSKSIKAGKSDHALSNEEVEAINQAMKKNDKKTRTKKV
jgi:hypothetical protein